MRRAACFFCCVGGIPGGILHAAGDNAPALRGGRIGPIAPIKSALQNPAGAGIIAIIAQHSAPEK